ncbi:class I SAM-dependent methyltransferase [Pseudomonadota bacterium]
MNIWIFIATSAAIALVIAGVCAFIIYHKLSTMIDRQSKQALKLSDNTIAQIEALLSLYAEVNPTHGFPPTRGWAASPDFLRLLTQFVNENNPKTIVECSSGLSTLILASCLRKQGCGKVFSLEHDPVFAEKTRSLLRLHSLNEWATVVNAPLVPTTLPDWKGCWYDMSNLPKDITINLLVIDGPPQDTTRLARYPSLCLFHNQILPKGVIILDDADRKDEIETVRKWLEQYPDYRTLEYLTAEKGVTALIKD